MAAATWAYVVSLLTAQSPDKAVSALESGRIEEAIQTLSEILSHAPVDPDANYYLGLAYYRQGHNQEACPVLERAARLAPSNASVWNALGKSQVAVNDLQGATVSLGKRAHWLPPKATVAICTAVPSIASAATRRPASPSTDLCARPRLRTWPRCIVLWL